MARRKQPYWRVKDKEGNTDEESDSGPNNDEIRKAVEATRNSSPVKDQMKTVVEGLFDTIEKLEEANRSTISALKRNGVNLRKTTQKLNNLLEVQEQLEKEVVVMTKTCEQNSKLLSKLSTLVITQSLK